MYIENILTKKVLAAGFGLAGQLVDQEDYLEGKGQQLWKRGEPNTEGYFTLGTSTGTKVMTAVSSSILRIKGNTTLNEK